MTIYDWRLKYLRKSYVVFVHYLCILLKGCQSSNHNQLKQNGFIQLFSKRNTEVNIGAVPLGGPNSIRIQSMTNTSTQDTQACVEQAKRIVDAAASMSADNAGYQGSGESDEYQYRATQSGYMVPLVADVHLIRKWRM